MKKLLTILCMMAVTGAFAQTEQGSSMVGGGLSFKTGKNNASFSLSPNYGYFFADNFAAGANINLNYSKAGTVKSTTFGFGPFARYYIGQAQTKPFIVGEFNFLNSKTTSGSSTVTNSGIGFLVGLGFAAFVNESVAVEGIAGYDHAKYKGADASGGFGMRLGFQIYFNKGSMESLKTNVMGQ